MDKNSVEAQRDLQTITAPINPNPILILGNQKSGTSAIAALLAELTGLSVTLDLKNEFPIPTYPQILQGQLAFSQFLQNYELDFSRDIVKEPNLTLLYPELAASFPESQFVFVLRDPRDNIRSILNRLKIPGDLSQLSPKHYKKVTPAWDLIIDNRWLGLEGENYIEMLSARWNFMADVFLNNRERMVLVHYEAFLKDKLGELTRLAHTLGLNPVNDITHRLDVQFQKRGDRDVKWQDFFGNQNLAQIEHICRTRMRRLDYPINREAELAKKTGFNRYSTP